MTRAHQPGHAVIAGGKTFIVQQDGSYAPFDRQRYREARPWARDTRRDTREQVL